MPAGTILDHMGSIVEDLGPPRGRLGAMLEPMAGIHFERNFYSFWGPSGFQFGAFRSPKLEIWGVFGPPGARLGAMLEPMAGQSDASSRPE